MVFLVVQWEGENSVSVVSETKLVQKNDVDMELTEGMNVEVLAGKMPREDLPFTRRLF